MNWRKLFQRKRHPDQKYCFRCGYLMDAAHNEQHKVGYNPDTGCAEFVPFTIRGWDLQYCLRDNVYIFQKPDGKWERGYDLVEVLHYIA